jgi:hypothetical protein
MAGFFSLFCFPGQRHRQFFGRIGARVGRAGNGRRSKSRDDTRPSENPPDSPTALERLKHQD